MSKNYCIFASQYLPHTGGVERYTYNLAKKLTERGNRVTIVTSNPGDMKSYEVMEGIRVYRIPCLMFMDNRFPVLKPDRSFRKIHHQICSRRYDLVIVNTRFYFHSLYGMFLAKKQKTACITIDHGTGHMLTGSPLSDKIGEMYEHMITMLEKWVCSRFYGVSGETVKWLAHFHIQAEGVLYNSIDMDHIQELYENPAEDFREKYALSEDRIVITYTGRLVREKGALNLAKAVEELHEKYPQICLFIAGDGELLEELLEKKNEYIIPLGKLSFEQVVALLRQTDIFCLPSDYPEGFPTSTLEAMACRCYPLVTERGGAREMIPDDSCGCVIANGSPEVLKPALEKAIVSPEMRNAATQKAYDRVREYFVWDRVADQIEEM